ncbi:MAG: YraN family protein [Candidatus Caldatribacterium sp.]|nr:YraN family protein [Candidatus Caldatribacterium sp.]MDW8080523.1 YraN family protein [Candidatus Calescibacterium sp.]
MGLPPVTGRASARSKGAQGERLAEQWLRRRLKAEILERNFRSPFGEIDFVARKGEILLFVEVKTRRSLETGLPEEAVTEEKKERLRKCALSYLAQRGYHPEMTLFRFDVIAVYVSPSGKASIRHYPSAF